MMTSSSLLACPSSGPAASFARMGTIPPMNSDSTGLVCAVTRRAVARSAYGAAERPDRERAALGGVGSPTMAQRDQSG